MWSVLLTLALVSLAHADLFGGRCCDTPIEYYGARDCKELLDRGAHFSDWYTIYPEDEKPMRVYCDMHTDGGGWIVFQRRWDGSVDFTRNWKSYKEGFGSRHEFWLGNEKIHKLTKSGKWELRIDLHDSASVKYHAKYSSFKIQAECEKYKLELGPFIGGNAGDSLVQHNKMKFTTFDEDNDEHATANCGGLFKGGWWFKSCLSAHMNGLYFRGEHKESNVGINWFTAKGDHYSFEHSEMKFRLVL
ncbi:ficolin-2-like [Dendropsophus ebraccatus]|uniref:ficolin-2-like n=1 Tax=Dendropsophus ebraccatus TaxID=150705 RepID=UPI003831A465